MRFLCLGCSDHHAKFEFDSNVNTVEIPLLRESTTFAGRLIKAAQIFGESRYYFHRRVNWSYRYSEVFYARESILFQSEPKLYVNGEISGEPLLDDVFSRRLSRNQILTIIAKVLAHTFFRFLGWITSQRYRRSGAGIYRKAYVDDIELVFDSMQVSVVRAVYPFPLNLKRQWRYLRTLHRQGHLFILAGNPYSLGDFLRFLSLRDIRSVMRMESRAQIRHAREVAAQGVHTVQLSDEFDIGSLDFSRALARYSISVVNSAHGVGKYFPVHAYQTFYVLTQRQRNYYVAVGACNYSLRQLNERSAPARPHEKIRGYDVVFLSQSFGSDEGLINQNEVLLIQRLQIEFSAVANLRLHYKPHPNRPTSPAPRGFSLLKDVADVNNCPNTLFLSFFSTCQIDPSFKGRKILVRGELIYPEISFDDTEEIVDIDKLVVIIHGLMKESHRSSQPSTVDSI